MNRKVRRILEPGVSMYFSVFIVFVVAAMFINPILSIIEALVVLVIFLVYRRNSMHRRREIVKYIESVTGNVNLATRDSVLNFPMPMMIMRPDSGEIIWSNDRFKEIFSEREHYFELKITDIVPDFPTKWLLEGKDEASDTILVGDRRFNVCGSLVRSDHGNTGALLATVYLLECTELFKVRAEFLSTRPVTAIILLDNYEELMKDDSDSSKSSMLAAIDARVSEWAELSGGLLRKFDRDKYLLIFEEQYLKNYIDGKFSLLESVQEILSPQGIPATLSIGIGHDGESFRDNYRCAALSIDMALSRGGDQAVIKNRFAFDFYGGRAKEAERRTKVKSRVTANALSELMKDSSLILIMGHKFPDMDCLGAACGIVCIARKLGKNVKIVADKSDYAISAAALKLISLPEYENIFLSNSDAMLVADFDTLLIVVDTSRPEQAESTELLLACNRVAVIDHHRRAATYIENAALNFHEPYASSASELVTELMQHLVEQSDILRVEAETLLSGIVLDTKSFSMRTGVRTFEAAAFLRRSGADTIEVKKLFQNDLESYVARFDIIRSARMYRDNIAVAAINYESDRISSAQAADELLNVKGVQASFVIYPNGKDVSVSARSMGQVNVQVILEKLGGGGNLVTAGAQVSDKSEKETLDMLLAAIDDYFDES